MFAQSASVGAMFAGTSDWTRYELVLDVAPDSTNIGFGVLLAGAGQVWIDDVALDVVSPSVPTTGRSKQQQKTPDNLDFDQ